MHCRGVDEDVVIPEAKGSNSVIAQVAAAYLIRLDLLGFSMLAPIEFNPNRRLRARRVQHVGSDGVLASER